ncbi:FeoB-associated Cys-rich membrane protein [Belliella marina]|uniref:FeoB-associated Cys-rich membrane protein n=1 Tax=Belliella marina TaxID=1644146 RepID=A0ABW4VIG1_9BACT
MVQEIIVFSLFALVVLWGVYRLFFRKNPEKKNGCGCNSC